MALTSETNPWSGNKMLVKYTNPIKSKVVIKTTAHIVSAIWIFLIIVTAVNTTAKARSKFSIATERI